ncbi:MAG TPA: hypothetical protein VE110_01305 [Gemmatimonadaceae bacterium]|nr:hypothetical protein [Gemmatimonadaceae bacterium]
MAATSKAWRLSDQLIGGRVVVSDTGFGPVESSRDSSQLPTPDSGKGSGRVAITAPANGGVDAADSRTSFAHAIAAHPRKQSLNGFIVSTGTATRLSGDSTGHVSGTVGALGEPTTLLSPR